MVQETNTDIGSMTRRNWRALSRIYNKAEYEGSKRKHRMFPQWQGWEDAKGTVGDTRGYWTDGLFQKACKETIPSSHLGKEGPGGSLNLSVIIFEGPGICVCVWNSRHPPALHVFLKAVVYFQNVSPLGSCGSMRLKVLFSIWPASVGSDVCSSVLHHLKVPIPADR